MSDLDGLKRHMTETFLEPQECWVGYYEDSIRGDMLPYPALALGKIHSLFVVCLNGEDDEAILTDKIFTSKEDVESYCEKCNAEDDVDGVV